MVMTMIWYDNMLVNCLLQSSCLCLCVCDCSHFIRSLTCSGARSRAHYSISYQISFNMYALWSAATSTCIYSPSSQWMSRLNQCLKLPLSLTNLWYIKKKNATFVVQYVLFTRCRLCHTHYMHFTTDEDRQSHTNELFVCVNPAKALALVLILASTTNTPTIGWKLWFAMGFYRIVNRTKCITL